MKAKQSLIKLLVSGLMAVVLISCSQNERKPQPVLVTRSVEIIKSGGLEFKDLNKNGKLDKYEDWRLSDDERIADLVSQMTLEEKVGLIRRAATAKSYIE